MAQQRCCLYMAQQRSNKEYQNFYWHHACVGYVYIILRLYSRQSLRLPIILYTGLNLTHFGDCLPYYQ